MSSASEGTAQGQSDLESALAASGDVAVFEDEERSPLRRLHHFLHAYPTVVPFIESLLGFKFLAKDVYYITDLPSEVQPADVIITASVAFLLTLAATLYPSWRAAKVNPVEALRYE